jgi:hypothetical protein
MTPRAERMQAYRLDRAAQDARFEAAVQGRDASETGTPEYAEYFGIGDYAGGGTEERVTLRNWLVHNRGETPPAVSPGGVSGAETGFSPSEPGGRPAWSDSEPSPAVPLVTSELLVTPEAAFWLTGQDLAELVAAGCPVAAQEQERRRVKRLAKRQARMAVAS